MFCVLTQKPKYRKTKQVRKGLVVLSNLISNALQKLGSKKRMKEIAFKGPVNFLQLTNKPNLT